MTDWISYQDSEPEKGRKIETCFRFVDRKMIVSSYGIERCHEDGDVTPTHDTLEKFWRYVDQMTDVKFGKPLLSVPLNLQDPVLQWAMEIAIEEAMKLGAQGANFEQVVFQKDHIMGSSRSTCPYVGHTTIWVKWKITEEKK